MSIAPRIQRAVAEPAHKPGELFDGFLVGYAPLLGAGQFGGAQHTGLGVAAGPRDERGRTSGEQIDPVERAVLFVEADDAALDLILPHAVAIKIEVKRRLQLAGVGAAAW